MGALSIQQVARRATRSTQGLSSTASEYDFHRIQPLAAKPIAALCVTKINTKDGGPCFYFKDRVQPIAAHPFASWRIVRLFPESYQTVMGCESKYVCDAIRFRVVNTGARINSYSSYMYPWIFIIFHAAATFASVSKYVLDAFKFTRRIGANTSSTSTYDMPILDIHRLFYSTYSAVSNLDLPKLLRIVHIYPEIIEALSSTGNLHVFLFREGKLIIRILSWLLTLKNMKCGQIVILEDPYI